MQLLSVADKTQSGTEEKQGAIHDTLRDMTHLLLKLQSLGTQIGSRLEGLSHKTGQSSWFTWFEPEGNAAADQAIVDMQGFRSKQTSVSMIQRANMYENQRG